jgi:hypothetical protein
MYPSDKETSAGSTTDTLQQLAEVKFWILPLVNHFVALAVEMYLSYSWRWRFQGWNMSEWHNVNKEVFTEMCADVMRGHEQDRFVTVIYINISYHRDQIYF